MKKQRGIQVLNKSESRKTRLPVSLPDATGARLSPVL
jgi:hypothetical protein